VTGNRWVGFTVVFLSSITIAMNQFKVPPVMDDMMNAFHLDMVAGGAVMSFYALTVIILVFPAAFVLSKIGAKSTGLIAIGCAAVGPLIGGSTTHFHVLLTSRIVEGVGSAFISVVAPTIIARRFNEQERGKPMGIWAGWVPLGVVVIFNLAVPLTDLFGDWRGLWWICAGLNAIFFVFFFMFIENDAASRPRDRHVKENAGGLASFGNLAVLALALAFFGTGFRDLGFSTWVPKYFREVLALDASYANFLNSFSFLVQLIGTVVGGAMMDAGFSRKALLLFAGVVTAVIAAFSFTLNPSWILPFMFGLGLMAGFIVICCFTGAAWEAASPAEIPWAIALCNFACFVGHLTAPVSVGAVVESHGWLAGTFVLEIGCLAIIVAAVVYTRFSGRRKTPVPPPLNGLFSR
jgi:predicted MFS family arabinose efflux permease